MFEKVWKNLEGKGIKMDVNFKVNEVDECVALIPIRLHMPKTNLKRKIYNIAKRGIDIIGGIFGSILLIPITIRNIYSTKIL